MQSENNELSKSSLCVISGLKRFGNRFTPQTECWFLMWFFFFPPVVWVSPLLAGNYSLCAAVEGSPGPGFGSEATVQHQSNCNTHSRMTIWAQLLSIIIVEFRGDKKKEDINIKIQICPTADNKKLHFLYVFIFKMGNMMNTINLSGGLRHNSK